MKVLTNDLMLGPPPGSLGDHDTSSSHVEITAWPLYPRPTPVAHGRELVRRTLTTLGLSDAAVDDSVIMVSELVTTRCATHEPLTSCGYTEPIGQSFARSWTALGCFRNGVRTKPVSWFFETLIRSTNTDAAWRLFSSFPEDTAALA